MQNIQKWPEHLKHGRWILKSNWIELNSFETDRKQNAPRPPMQTTPSADSLINLPEIDSVRGSVGSDVTLNAAVYNRKSRRKFSDEALSLTELTYLLWATQGVRKKTDKMTLRTVPSGGARHPFETYIFVQRVEGLEPGLYHYLPLDHKLELVKDAAGFEGKSERVLNEALLDHNFGAAATFIWTALPYRSERAYAFEAYRLILLDAGHVCQNLYLACEAIGAGTCAVGAYDQEKSDRLLGVDGNEEFVVYAAPVGKALD
ncbi:MAG: SagB/ThcOx family dehydrogenase [bacterium]